MFNSHPLKFSMLVLVCTFAVQGVLAQSESDPVAQLRVDYETLLDAREDFKQAEKHCNTSTQELADYAAWIQRLSEQLAESCRVLSAYSGQSIPADIPCVELTSAYVPAVGIDIGQETTDEEKTANVVGRFNETLGEFDEKLLREQDRVKANRPQNTSVASGAGGGIAGGAETGSGESPADADPAEGTKGGQRSDQQGSDVSTNRDQSETDAQGSPSRGKKSNIPDDIPDDGDDDVIARQLREAAEKETDPELRAKLWEEYRRYKNG